MQNCCRCGTRRFERQRCAGSRSELHESFFLIRTYNDQVALEEEQQAFYASEAWRNGPRGPHVACIDTYLNTLLWLPERAVEDLRLTNGLGGQPQIDPRAARHRR